MSAVNASASFPVERAGCRRERLTVDPRDRLHLARRRRQERLVGAVQRVVRQRGLLDRDAEISRELEHERAGDPQQAARVPGRGVQHVLEHEEHVRASRLAQVATSVGEHRLAGAVLVGVGERAHVLRVGDRLQSRDRAAVVAGPRHGHDVGAIRARRELGGRDDHCQRRVTPFGPERRLAAGNRDPQPGGAELVRREHRIRGFAQRCGPGHVEADAGGRRHQPLVVAGPRERHAVVDPQRLEDAVADEQTVVERRDAQPRDLVERPVQPDLHSRSAARGRAGLRISCPLRPSLTRAPP